MAESKAVLKVSIKEAFKMWLEFTRPFNKLTNQELEFMAMLLYHRHVISKEVNSEMYINKILFGTEMRKQYREEMNVHPQILLNILSNLRKKGIIVNDTIRKPFIPKISKDPKDKIFKIIFELQIDEGDGKG